MIRGESLPHTKQAPSLGTGSRTSCFRSRASSIAFSALAIFSRSSCCLVDKFCSAVATCTFVRVFLPFFFAIVVRLVQEEREDYED